MQDLLKLETRAESLLNVRLIYLVVEYTFSGGYAKNPVFRSTAPQAPVFVIVS